MIVQRGMIDPDVAQWQLQWMDVPTLGRFRIQGSKPNKVTTDRAV